MKINSTMKGMIPSLSLMLLFLFINIGLSAQDWVKDGDNLYYLNEKGKVFISPDYSSMAIYFSETPSKQFQEKFESKVSQRLSSEKAQLVEPHMMELKGMMFIKNSRELSALNDAESKEKFIEEYALQEDGVYEVLPSFEVDGIQAWFTKRIIISLKDGFGLDQITEILTEYNAHFIRTITDEQTFLIEVEDISSQLALIHALDAISVLKWGEPDFKMELQRRIDPIYSQQWFLNNTGGSIDGKALVNDVDIDAPEAWAITTGSSLITVAVIDDGVEAHEDMGSLSTGYTPANNGDGTPYAANDGHGQACAGIIAAQHNEIGVRGVAPGVSMFSVNIFHPSTTNADVATAITWAVNNGADVLSNSWGYSSCTVSLSALNSAFSNAATNGRGGLGCIVLVASGNDFSNCVGYPANLSTVMAVGGVSGDGERSMYSNYGPTLDIVAPSDDDWVQQNGQWYSTGTHGLRTIDRMGTNGWASGSSNYYDYFGGTSGATPQVSGVAALILSVNSGLTKTEVQNILTSTADDEGIPGFDNEYGHGRVNAHQALLAAGPVNCVATVPTGLSATAIGSNFASLSWDLVQGANYDLRYRETGNSWININVSSTSYTLSGLNSLSSYEAQVRSNCPDATSSAYSAILSFSTTDVQLDYCSSASINVNDEYISNVQIGSINNSSGAQFYSDFTSISTTLTEGDAATITVTPTWTGTIYSEGYAVWIDYNIDGDFNDVGEQVWTQSATTASSVSGSFTVPASATEGSTRMRVSMKYNGIPSSCETFTWGEVEDYTVVISSSGSDTEAPSVPLNLSASNITETSMVISWDASSDNVGVTDYDVYQNGSFAANVNSNSYNASGLTQNTNYSFYVIANDAAGNSSGASFPLNVSTLTAPTCDDGIQNGDETGIDCGGSCIPCATCDDGIQNGDETGIDCGGSCAPCPPDPTCDDGIQNGDETGIDCGGSCIPCATCDDGIQNGDETGIDCGGSCAPCPPDPTCDDGIQNGDETGIDCGGSCIPCATCDDGIQNGDETGIDCGGSCAPCPPDPTCDDGIQNGDETGIDCGGSCIPCATCDDGIQNGDETGIDCGGSCAPCPPDPTCDDGIQNGDETGIDCGGSCAPCPPDPTCDDGIQNGDETGIDCGGSCIPCATCDDGIQNGDETGVDCGGSCIPCATCDDGIQNGDETGIDCGGSCAPCPPDPTCDDGIQNGDETGIDCGGSCIPCDVGSVIIHEGFFETGWDGWADGGTDCYRYNGSRSYEGSKSIRLRDNSGGGSTMTSQAFDLSSYDQVEVEFFFYSYSMENNEDFWLRYYNGSSWTTVATWARGTDFNNNTFYTSTVILSADDYTLASNAQFRFQCDASSNQDHIYIDAVTIRASTFSAYASGNYLITMNSMQSDIGFTFEEDFLIYPNPVSGDNLQIVFADDIEVDIRIYSITGQVLYNGKGIHSKEIDVSEFIPGMYFIEVNDGEEAMTQKFIKK